MPDVQSLLQVTDTNVRKWGTQLFFLMAPDAPIEDHVWFGPEDRLPVLPDGTKQLGYITTDGIASEDSISSEPTQMLQTLETVRSDLTGIEKTMTVAFGEDNGFVQALWHGKPFEEFPEDPQAPWVFDDGDISQYPFYRGGWIGQDGVGSQARYRVEFGYRITLTAKESRSANRSDPETYGFTFGLYKDPAIGLSFTRGQNGPAYHNGTTDNGTTDPEG